MKFSPLRFQSYRQGALHSTILNVISRGLGFVVNLVIAYHFGTGEAVGVYFFCLSTVFTVGLFLGMVNASVLIPESMMIAECHGETQSQAFLNVFLVGYAWLGLALMLALQYYPVELLLLLSRFDRELLEAHAGIVKQTTMLLPLVMLSAFLMEVLNSRRFFTVGILANLTNGLFVLAFILLFRESLGVGSIAIGMIIGYLFQVSGALVIMKRLLNWRFRLGCQHHRSQVWKDISFAQFGNICTAYVSYLPIFLLSHHSATLVAALTFGVGLSALPNTIISDQVSAVTGIKLNTLVSLERWGEANEVFIRSSHFMVFILVPICIFSSIYAEQLVSIIYGRGYFDLEAISNTSAFLRFLVCSVPLVAINSIVSKLFIAARKIREAVWYQIVLNVFMALAILLSVELAGPLTYPIGLLFVYGLNSIFCYYLIRFYFPAIQYGHLAKKALTTILLDMVLVIPIYWAQTNYISYNGYFGIFLSGAVYGIVIISLNHYFRLNEDFRELIIKFLVGCKSPFFAITTWLKEN